MALHFARDGGGSLEQGVQIDPYREQSGAPPRSLLQVERLRSYFCGGKSLAIISPNGPVRLVMPRPARLRYGSGSSGKTSSAKR